jgi:hypothetical protein
MNRWDAIPADERIERVREVAISAPGAPDVEET